MISFGLFFGGLLQEKQFVFMTISFFVLTLICLYLPHLTRLKIGPVELEKVSAKSLSVQPLLEK